MLYGQIYQMPSNVHRKRQPHIYRRSVWQTLKLVGEPYSDEMRQSYEPMIDALGSETDQALLQNICNTISSQLNRSDWRRFLRMARSQLPQSG